MPETLTGVGGRKRGREGGRGEGRKKIKEQEWKDVSAVKSMDWSFK